MRIYKGQSLLTLLDDYCVIDIETSNNGRRYGEIVEISCLKVRNNQIVDSFDELIKPEFPIDKWTQSIHHISNEMVKDKPSIKEIYPKLLKFIQNDLLIGHNVHFDINFIYDYFEELNQPPLSNDFLDTLRLARRTLKGLKSYSLSNLSTHIGYEPTIHRALEDCIATHNLYQYIKQRLSLKEIEELSQVKTRAQLSTRPNYADLKPQNTLFENNNSIFNKKAVVFTGKLNKFTRKQAAQIVVNNGGKVFNDFDQHIDILVVGDIDYQLKKYNRLSTKHRQALLVPHIIIMSEEEFMTHLD